MNIPALPSLHKPLQRLLATLILALFWHSPAALAASCDTLVPQGSYLTNFGSFAIGGPNVDVTGQINFHCSPPDLANPLGVSYTLRIGPGINGSFSTRRLSNGPNNIGYNLYRSAVERTGATAPWGTGAAGTNTVAVAGNCGNTCNVFVYGRLFASTTLNISSGQYTDVVDVFLDY